MSSLMSPLSALTSSSARGDKSSAGSDVNETLGCGGLTHGCHRAAPRPGTGLCRAEPGSGSFAPRSRGDACTPAGSEHVDSLGWAASKYILAWQDSFKKWMVSGVINQVILV